MAHGLLYVGKYVITRDTYFCPVNNQGNIRWYLTHEPHWTASWSSKFSSYDYIGRIYLNDRNKITDNGGRTILTEYGVFGSAPHVGNLITVLYLGGDANYLDHGPLTRMHWNWYLLDRVPRGD